MITVKPGHTQPSDIASARLEAATALAKLDKADGTLCTSVHPLAGHYLCTRPADHAGHFHFTVADDVVIAHWVTP